MYLVITRAESRGSLLSGLVMKTNPESEPNANKCPVNNVLYNPSGIRVCKGGRSFATSLDPICSQVVRERHKGLCSALPSVNNCNVDLLIYSPSADFLDRKRKFLA